MTQEAFQALKPLFEKYDASEPKFPHPYLGDMTAVEWLAMYGAHERRHLRQIERGTAIKLESVSARGSEF